MGCLGVRDVWRYYGKSKGEKEDTPTWHNTSQLKLCVCLPFVVW